MHGVDVGCKEAGTRQVEDAGGDPKVSTTCPASGL